MYIPILTGQKRKTQELQQMKKKYLIKSSPHSFMIQNNFSKPEIEGNILNLIKDIYQKSTADRFNNTTSKYYY